MKNKNLHTEKFNLLPELEEVALLLKDINIKQKKEKQEKRFWYKIEDSLYDE